MPGDTLATKTWALATTGERGTYRRVEHDRWFTDPDEGPTLLYSAAIYTDLLPYRALTRNLPVDTNQPQALGTGLPVPDAQAPDPGDVNFVRTWVPRVALTSAQATTTPTPAGTPAASAAPAPTAPVVHLLRREQWDNLARPQVSALPLTTAPARVDYVLGLETPFAYTDQSGERLRGWLTAPQTGDYTFFLSAGASAELWLSLDDSPANRQRLAYVSTATAPRDFTQQAAQQSAPVPLVQGQRYYLEVLHAAEAGQGSHYCVAWQPPGSAQLPAPVPAACLSTTPPASGGVFRELWTNAPGPAVTDIPLATPPTSVTFYSQLEGPTNDGDQYGARYRGYLVPPVSGSYTFALAADDNGIFRLSPDADPAHALVLAQVSPNHYAGPREWGKYAEQQSAPQALVAGQRYYFEVLHKEDVGLDNLALGWQQPGESGISGPVPGSALAPYLVPYTTAPIAPASATAPPPGGSPTAADTPDWTIDQASRTTQYLDGLGRPIQTVRHQASPQRRDLVQAQAYDGLGREPQQLLPYAAAPAQSATNATTAQGFHYRALSEQQDFYGRLTPLGGGAGPLNPDDPTQGVARSAVAYGETLFEASPLSRVLAQAAPGQQWSLTSGHIQQRAERPNALGLDSVLFFRPGYDPRSLDPGYQDVYAPGQVWGVQRTDEQGFVSIEWQDKLGQVVQKQVELARVDSSQAQPSRTPQPRRWLRTCYVYDDFGHLRFVLQPQATRGLLAAVVTASLPPPPADLQLWLPGGNPAGQRVRDAASPPHDGTLVGGAWPAPGPAPTPALGLTLSGSDRIAVPLSLPASQSFTVAFWVRPTQLQDHGCLLSARLGQGGDDPWGTFAFHTDQDGRVYAGINYWDYHGRLVTDPGLLQAGQWQHFVFTYDQGTATLYRNGTIVGSPLTGMPAAPAWPALLLGGVAANQSYNGSIADLRRYARALSAAEVLALAQPVVATPPVLPASAITALQPYLFHYRFDGRGRQIAKQVPGTEGETQVVYDQLDRPVLSQDASQRQRQEWSWTKYDALGRVILSGLVSRQDTLGQVSLQAIATADTATAHQYEQRTADRATFAQFYTTNQSFPQLGQNGFSAGPVLTASYYDDYDFNNDGQPDADAQYNTSTDGQFPSGLAPVADVLRTTGMSTRTSTRVLGVAETDATQAAWLTTTTFYDERARPVQVQTTNARKGTDLLTTQLDFTGKVVQRVARHQGPSLASPLQVAEFFTYDHSERLLSSRQQLPGEAHAALLDSVQYNEIGQVTRKSLATGRLRQDVDYAYNIRGWLTSLNDPYSPNPTKHDLFSLSLHYDKGFTPGYEQYNGNLTGQTWRGRDGVQRAQGYVYDPLNRLLQGDFVARTVTPSPGAGAWNQELDNYRLSFVSYDDNGNIATLRRRGLLQAGTSHQTKQYGAVDNLSYAYQGNRLQAVDDAVSGNQLPQPATYHGAPTSLAGDFQEAGVKQGQEYLYDANGNLTADKNKGITGILYNHLNLPRQIHFGQGADSVVFRYAASGQKVAKLVYQTGQPTPRRTDYLGPYQYEQDSLKFFPHAEGRVLRFVSKDPAGQVTVRYQREYTIKDHLGNLRLAYRAGQVRTLLATLEQDENTHKRESQQFDSLSVSAPVAVQTPYSHGAGSWAARLNAGGSAPQPLGPLTQLGVQQGDTVTVTAFGLYPQAQQHGFLFSLGSFLAGLFHPASPPPPSLDGRKRQDLPLLQVGVAAGLASIPQLAGGVPPAYLRVLVFNRDSALVDQQSQQLSKAAAGNYERLNVQLVLPQDGYVTAYVGSQSDVDVFFDDVQVEHRPGLQVQENQYDPWGLELAGLAPPSPGIRGLNNYRFNGKEFQADLGLAWNHQDWRFFDPQLLRWHAGDPEIENGQESWSPYSFGFDNAVRFADANGREPGDPPVGSVAGLLYNTVVGTGVSLVNASIMLTPGADAVTSLTMGGTFRASLGGNGEVSYGIRPTATSLGGLAANTASDVLDLGVAALTVFTAGEAAPVGGSLRIGAGMLFEQASVKIGANAAEQEVKTILRSANRITNANSKASSKLNSLYQLESKDGSYLKTGITSKKNPESRYTREFMKDKQMKILDQGSRADMLKKERHIVERNPGPLNFEPWAGSKSTQ